LTLLLLASSLPIQAGSLRQAPNQAALVVVHGDGRVVTRCVDFSEAQITGADLLQRSGLDLNIEASSMGATICRIDGEGCTFPQQSCFCQCEGAGCSYWSYWHWQNGDWLYSQLGASNSIVLPGSMDGWVWGAGTVDSAPKPPPIPFVSVCAPPTPTETPSLTPTHTESWAPPTTTPTATPTLSEPTATDTPAATNTATPLPALAGVQPLAPTTPETPTPVAAVAPIPTSTPTPSSSVAPAAPTPLIEFFGADRREISFGESVTLAWRIRDADTVQLQAFGQTVTVAAEGNMQVTPPQNTTYQLIGSGPGGSASSALTVVVRPAQPQQQTAPSPTHTPAEETTDASPIAATPTIDVESPDTVILIAPRPAILPSTPTSNATPTLAPLSATSEVVATAIFTQPEVQTPVTPLLMLVGLAVLVGLPLLGVAGFLLVWLMYRPK
jgi:hypothetical protein